MLQRVTIRLEAKLIEEIDRLSELKYCSRSDFARDAVKRFVKSDTFRVNREAIAPFAEAKGILVDADCI